MFLWVWELEKTIKKSGGIDSLIDKLKNMGIENLCIKFHEGSSEIGDGVNFKEDFLKYRDKFKSEGFTLGTWGYNYFNSITREISLIHEGIQCSDYYIFDPEAEVKNKKDEAEEVCRIIREKNPHAVIGYSSYAIPSYHRALPYEIFDKYCDFFSPQTYFQEMGWDVNKCIDKMISDVNKMELKCPVVPSLQGHLHDKEMYEQFEKYEYPYCGIWVLDFLDSTCESWIEKNLREKKTGFKDIKMIKFYSTDKEINRYNYDVLKIQRCLNKIYMENGIRKELVEDGIFGEQTKGALENFVLRLGFENPLVRVLQEILCTRGYSFDLFGADGIFGYETYRKIKEFQSRTGIVVDGIVGSNTWRKILE